MNGPDDYYQVRRVLYRPESGQWVPLDARPFPVPPRRTSGLRKAVTGLCVAAGVVLGVLLLMCWVGPPA